ncbi:MAG: hypothetical protein HYU97_04075 [Deltaproteobacteria bacterium]|nr:hypothetical protein [Deltaproteobacteria bacterium]
MQTRITVDLKDSKLLSILKWEAAQENKTIRQIVEDAVRSYFSHKLENEMLLKAAQATFAQWDNPQDADYDHL